MKFYDSLGLPNPDRVRIALAEKGVLDQVEIIQVNLWEGEHCTAAFKAKNPSVTVPLLELDNGTALSETTAITEYIDHTFDGIPLTGRGA
jgi:glutathione S-transferase